MEIKNEEFVCYENYPKKRKDGSITVRGLLNIYTDEGTFSEEIIVNCKP